MSRQNVLPSGFLYSVMRGAYYSFLLIGALMGDVTLGFKIRHFRAVVLQTARNAHIFMSFPNKRLNTYSLSGVALFVVLPINDRLRDGKQGGESHLSLPRNRI